MCHPLCTSQRFGKREPGKAGVVYPKRMLSRVGKRSSEHVSRVLGRLSKRQSESRVLGRVSKRQSEETSPRMLTRMSKRNEEATTRILGRMTKRGKFANMRWRRRAEDELPGGERRALEGPAEIGKHWINLALDGDKGPAGRPDAWGRVSKRLNHDDGRRFSRIGMVKREAEMAKRSGVSGRFIRIGMVGEEEERASQELRKKRANWNWKRIVRKRSGEGNDQSSRWIRIGVNQEHEDWGGSFPGRISKRAGGQEWNHKFDQSFPLDLDLLTQLGEGGGAAMDGDEEVGEDEDEGEVGEGDRHAGSLEEEEAEFD